jgi:YD repeat-containing protein
MVAVITGNGLGLGNTSLTQLGQAQGGSPNLGQAANSSYVNAATGNLILQSNDEEGLLFDGLPLNVLRTYNSQGQLNGNNGWTYGFTRNVNSLTGTVNTAGSTITRTDDDGSSVVYTYNATLGAYVSTDQSGAVDTLSWNATSSTWSYTDAADNTQETYNAAGQLTALADTATGASYSFSYSNGQLSQIVAGDGDTLIFGYNTSNQLISLSIQEVPPGQTAAVTRQMVQYSYDNLGRLNLVVTFLASDTDNNPGYIYTYNTNYTYQGTTDLVASVTQSDGTTVSYTYTQDAQGVYQVTGVTTGIGAATAQSVTLSYGADSTTVIDSAGNATTYKYNTAGELTEVIAPAVNGVSPTTTYTYDSDGNLLTSTDPDGAVTSYSYDSNGNLLSVEDGTGNTVNYTYNSADQITSKTTYTVPAQGEAGQSDYVAPSGAQTTYYVYNANNQLAYTVDPLGNVSENDYTSVNGLSELTASRQYLGATYSSSSNNPGNPPTLAQLQAWVQSSAVQGTLSQSTLTSYTYDVRGQLATQTRYDTVDSNGNGVLTNGTVVTTTTYDAYGKLLQTSIETGANRSTLQTTSYAYDGMGRMISKIDPLGNATTYVYSFNTLVITQANGSVTTQVTNNAGQIVSTTQSTVSAEQASTVNISANLPIYMGSTSTTYTSAELAYGTYQIAQANGASQGVEGIFATVNVYSSQTGDLIYKRLYATPITEQQYAQLLESPTAATLQSMLVPSSSDQISLTIYSSSGQQQAQVQYGTYNFTNPDGSSDPVTGSLVTMQPSSTETIRYATPLTVAQLDSLGETPTLSELQALVTSSANDQTTINAVDSSSTGVSASIGFGSYVNNSGVPVAGEFISVYHYNSQGIETAFTRYLTPLTAAQIASLGSSPTVAQIEALITTSPDDQIFLLAHNSNGALISEIYHVLTPNQIAIGQNADGSIDYLAPGEYVEVYQYNSSGARTGSTIYTTPLTADQVASLGTAPTDSQIQALITTGENAFTSTGISVGSFGEPVYVEIYPGVTTTASGPTFGQSVQFTYSNSSGDLTSQVSYANPLTAAQVSSLGDSPTAAQIQALVQPSNYDEVYASIYDSDNRVLASISPQTVSVTNPDGSTSSVVEEYVTTFQYNSQGMQIARIVHANPLTPLQVESLGTTPTMAQLQALLTPSSNDQTNLTIYDANGGLGAQVSYQTHYFTNPDGSISTVTGEFATLYITGNTGNLLTGWQLYKTPLTAAQMAALGTSPSLTTLEDMLAGSNQARLTVYGYDSDGNQISSTNTEGQTSYTLYNADGELAYTIDADGDVVGYDYNVDGQVIQTTQYATPLTASQLATLSAAPTTATVQSFLTSSAGDLVTNTIYNAAGEVVATIDPAGNVTTTTYDGTGNMLSTTQYAIPLTATQRSALGIAPTLATLQADLSSNANDRTTLTIYDADGQATAVIDPDGNVKVMSYDGAGDMVSSTTYPTPLTAAQIQELRTSQSMSSLQLLLNPTAQTIYNTADQPVATISASGVVTITSYDANGNATAVTTYATPLTQAQVFSLGMGPTLAQVLSVVTPSASDVTTLAVYNSSNQEIAKVNAQGQVTAYTYDAAGNITSVTVYANALSASQVASLGTEPTWVALQASITPSANDQTSYTLYDSNERQVATVSPTGMVTIINYGTEGMAITTQYATALTAQALADFAANPTLSTLQGEVVSSASDQTSLAFYNASQQNVASLSSHGIVTLNTFDSSGNLINTVVMGTPLSAAQLSALQQSPSLTSLQADLAAIQGASTTSLTFYNANGQPVATVSSSGIVTITTYGSNGNVASTVQYANTLTAQQIEALGANASLTALQALIVSSSDDVINIYNAAGQPVAKVSNNGYVEAMTYDTYGNVSATVYYNSALTAQNISSLETDPSLVTLQSMLVPSTYDDVSIRIYDANHNLLGSLDNGDITITTYDASNEVIANTSYGNEPAVSQAEALAQDPTLAGLQALITPSVTDETTLTVRNANEQPVATVTPVWALDSSTGSYAYYGQVTLTTYGATSVATTTYANLLTPQQVAGLGNTPTVAQIQALVTPSSSDKTSLAIYDANGRLVASITPIEIVDPSTGAISYGGSVTLISYNSAGIVDEKVGYATPLTASQMAQLGDTPTLADVQSMVTPSASDQVTTLTIYNASNQSLATLIPQQNGSTVTYTVVMSTYNAAGQLASTVQYANTLTGAQVSTLESDPTLSVLQSLVVPSSEDQTTLNYYNANNQLIATLVSSQSVYDPATGETGPGYFATTYTYDADGNQILALGNTQGLTSAQVSDLGSNPTLAQLESLIDTAGNSYSSSDITIYNADEQVVATVDNGTISTTSYNSNGQVAGTVTYYYGLATFQITALVADPTLANLMSMVDASPFDKGSFTLYSANGSIAATLTLNTLLVGDELYFDTATLSTYDASGNLVSSTTYSSNAYGTSPSGTLISELGGNATLSQVLAVMSSVPDSATNVTIRDASGNVVGTVNGYYAIIYGYDAAGNQISSHSYSTPLTQQQLDQLIEDPTLATLQAMVQPSTSDYLSATVYGANGQILGQASTSGGVTLSSYDANGDLLTTKYTTNLSISQLESLGESPSVTALQLDVYADQGDTLSQTFYNAAGKPIATIAPDGSVTTMTYDAAGNVTSTTQYAISLNLAAGQVGSYAQLMSALTPSSADLTTRTIYNVDEQPIAQISATGQVTVTGYNAAGDAVTTTEYATPLTAAQMATLGTAPAMAALNALLAPTTRMIYNAAGEKVATIDPEGDTSYSFYNSAGELAGTVDADGHVTTYSYDADGDLTQTTQYATPISTAGWLNADGTLSSSYPGSLPIPPSSSQDRTTTSIYDSVGNVVATIDPSGNVTTTTYDAFGDAISSTAYATPLTSAQMASLGSSPTLAALELLLTTSPDDRTATAEYDADGREIESTDAAGFVTLTTYDADGNVVLQQQEISAGNYATTRSYYDAAGRLIAQVDADGYLTVDSYDTATDTTTTTRYATALTAAQIAALTGSETTTQLVALLGSNTANEQTSNTYNANNQVISSTAADGTVTTYQYDPDGQLIGTTTTPVSGQGAARSTSTTYDTSGNITSTTDADGNTITYLYNANGERIESTDAMGNSTWYYYDPDGQLIYTVEGQPSGGQVNSLGDVTAYTYDAFGDVTSTTVYASQLQLNANDPSSGNVINPGESTLTDIAAAVAALPQSASDVNDTTTDTYTNDGQLASVTDGDGYETAYSYNAFGDLTQVQQQLSQAGQALTTANSTTTDYVYNADGEQIEETDAVGTSVQRSTSATYDGLGDVLSTTDGMGDTTTYQYDALGRQISSSQQVQGQTRTTQTSYDAFGRVLSTTDALGHTTTYSYNLATHTTTVTTPDGVTMTTVKDAYGDTVSITDGAGNTTSYTYDADGNLLSTTDALGNVSTDQYDADGNLIKTTNADGDVVTYSYDADGRVLSQTVDPNGLDRVTTYTYDGEGREVSVTDPLGTVTTYAYDADGNVLTQVQDAGGINLTTTYTYDGDGKTLTVTQGAGSSVATTTQYVYDALERMVQKIVDPTGLAMTTTYQYDANNNLVATTDPYGDITYTLYNEANEAIYTIASANGSQSGDYTVAQNTYDADGNLVSTTQYGNFAQNLGIPTPDATATTRGSSAVTQNLAIGATYAAAASSSDNAVSYSVYNADGQVIYQIDPSGVVTETRYNSLGQVAETLIYATPISISGNLGQALQTGAASASDMQAALAAAGDSDGTAHVTYAYYDADGRQVYSIVLNQVDGVLSALVSGTNYDSAGNIVSAVQFGVPLPLSDVGNGATTASITQALNQLEPSGDTRSTQYIYDKAGEQVAQIDPNGNISYIFYDADGDVVATVDPTGAVVQYMRDDLGRVIEKISYAHTVITSNWIVGGQVVATLSQAIPASDPAADRVTLTTYDAVDRVSTVTTYSEMGENSEWVENANGTESMVDTYVPIDGDTLTYTYDNDSRVVQTSDVDISGNSPTRTTYYFYGTQQNTVSILNADGYLSVNLYDASGRLLQTTTYAVTTQAVQNSDGTWEPVVPAYAANDETTSYYYDALGHLAGTLDGDGYFTSYTYDLDGRQTSETRYANALTFTGQQPFRYTAGEDYPSVDAVAAEFAGESYQQTSQTYDSYGDVLTSTDAQGFVTQYTYDDLGNVIQTVEAAGTSQARTTSNIYDAYGELVSSTDGLGNVTTYTYDANGNKTSVTDPLGNTTWYVYDQDNRLTFTIVGLADSSGNPNVNGQVSQTTYDTFGDVASTIDYSDFYTLGANFTPTQSLMLGAAESIRYQGWNPDGVVTYSYDLEGNVVTKTDGDDFETDYTYDGFNQLVSKNIGGESGLLTQYTYDNMGHLTSQVDEEYIASSGGSSGESGSSGEGGSCGESGSTSGWTPIRQQSWAYDAFGNVSMYVDGDGEPTLYVYDDLNQQIEQVQPYSGQARITGDTYDAYGRILTSTDGMGHVTSYSYDDADDSVTEVQPGGIQSTTVYNAEGQVTSVTDGNGNVTRYSYDADGNLTQTTNPDGTTVTNQYDADGNLIKTTDADGNVTAYTYDAEGHVLTKTVDPDGLNLVMSYTYDGRGLMISETDPNGIVTKNEYDGNGNLLYVTKDANGTAPISASYSYNDLNEVTASWIGEMIGGSWQWSESTYSYDVLGRMTAESLDTGHETQVQYTYDGDGNVTSETDGNGNVTYYYYNGANQLTYEVAANGAVTYTTYNLDEQVTSVTQYATELPANTLDLLAEMGSTGGLYLPYVIQTSADDRTTYSVYNSAGQLAYTVDPNGNVTQSIYNDLGQVAETLAYATPIQLSASAVTDLQSGNAAAMTDVQAALSTAGDSSDNAKITYTYYDDMGRVSCMLSSATLNGQSGYLATQTQYDADGNVIAQIQYGDLVPSSLPNGAPSTATVQAYLAGLSHMQVTRTVYDAAGRVVYSINPAGDVTQTEYDNDGRVTATLQYAIAIGTPAAWTQADVAAAVQTANAGSTQTRETQNFYDDFGNLIKTIDGDGNVTSYTYDQRGLKLSSTDGAGNTTYYTYDQYGNLITETSPPVAVASYSSTGAYQGTTTESIVTTYEYDNDGNLTEEIDASNTAQARTTQYRYDAVSNLIQTIQQDPGAIDQQTGLLVATGSNPTITITYNAFGQAVASEDANGNVAYNVYDHDGNLLYAIDGDGYVTGYTYNAYGQQTSVTRYATGIDTVGAGWSISQPPSLAEVQAALVTSSSDRTIATAYDAQGNKISVTEPVITYTNSDGSKAQGSPVTEYTYDAYGHVTSQSVLVQGTPGTGSAVWATTYNYYDASGNKLMSVDPMGYVTTSTYDAFGDVLSTTEWATAISTSDLVAGGTMPADPPAVNTSTTTATTGLDRVTTYTYDNAGNKTSQSVLRSYTNAQGTPTVGWDTTTYGYDADNRLTTVTENNSTVTTAYDALGRITSVTGPQVEVLVDDWQTLLEANSSLTLSSPSLYTMSAQVVSYAYDAFGDKLEQTQSATNSSLSVSSYYQYDNAGHLVASLTPLDNSGANWTSDQAKFYAYDGNGNLVSEWYTLTGDDSSTTLVTTNYTYDHDNQQTSSVTWRAGVPSPDKQTSTTYDAFGEVIASGDGVTNNVVTTYDNAGNKLTSTDPTSGELHTYGYNLAGQMVTDSVPVAASVGTGSVETIYTLDLDGRVIAEQAPSTDSATGENTGVLHATYDAWGNLTSSTDANGNTISYTYNERNDVVTTTEASVSVMGINGQATTETPVTTRSYDIEGNVLTNTDEDHNVTTNVYNALGQKIESTDGTGAISYTGYDALGNAVATQDGNGTISFTNIDALGRAIVTGQFIANGQGGYQLVWQQAYELDQNGDRIVSYNGIGSAYLQTGDTTDAALNASYAGYDSQGHVIWSQDAAQHAASTEDDHQNYAGNWTQTPTNANFSQGLTGWSFDPGYSAGSYDYDGQDWPLMFSGSSNANGGAGGAVNNDRVPVIPGQTITANGQFEVLSQNGNGEMFINWYNAEGQMIGQSNNGPGITGGKGSGINSVTGTAPAGAAYASIAIGCSNYNEGFPGVVCSGVWWDYVPPAGTTVLGTGNTGAVVTLPGSQFTDQADNTNFDQGNTGWDTNGWSIHTASNANSGWEATYNGVGTAVMVNQDRVPVAAGQTISASMQLALDLAPSGAIAGGAVAINWYDASGNLITTDTGTWVDNDRAAAWETSYITSTAPSGAAYASLAVVGSTNGIGKIGVENAQWNYQYIPQAPTGVVQDSYVYNMDGDLVSETTADGDNETWQYNQYGQVTSHTDLSGAQYTYTYDAQTGQEIGESDNWSPSAQGQVAPSYVTAPINTPNSETLTYYADGQVASETFSDGSSYTYQYDANGNLISEEDTTADGNDNAVQTLTQTTYDSHNRISSVTETNELTGATMLTESFAYDAAGNRREVDATSDGTNQDAWYTYDGDNRVEINDGALVNNQIVITSNTESYENAYDADGNVIRIFTKDATTGDLMSQSQVYNAQNELIETLYAVDVTQGGTSNGVETTTTYDANGNALVTSTYYETGATITVQNGNTTDGGNNSSPPDDGQAGTSTVDVGGMLESATVNFYDVVGRLAESQSFSNASDWDGTPVAPPTGPLDPNATTYGNLQYQSEVVYQGPDGTSGYDADGDVVAYQYRDNTGLINQYQVTYLKKDTYLQAQTEGVNVAGGTDVQPATDSAIYDTRGDEVALEQHTEDPSGDLADTVHVFAYNGNGEIIEREDATGTDGTSLNLGSTPSQEIQNYTYVNGQQLAHFDNDGTLDVLDEVTAFSSNNDSPDSYVVQSGDTLQSIAQAEYGDSNLWYVIAQANDLSSASNLVLGQRLQIPAVTTHSNSSSTFKPYDPSSIVGSTTPNLPQIAPPVLPPDAGGGCSVAQILVLVVTIVVTALTYGSTSEFLVGELGSEAAGDAAAGALAGVAGSLAGQATGVAEGLQSGINWGDVLESGLADAVTFGAAGALSDGGIAAAEQGGTLFANGVGQLTVAGDAVVGAASYLGSAVAGEITDQPEHFSWAGLVGSVVGAAVGGEVASYIPQTSFLSSNIAQTTQYAVGDIVGREVSVALGDRHQPSWAQVGENILSYAIGTPIGEAAAQPIAAALREYQTQNALQAIQAQSQQLDQQSQALTTSLNNQVMNQIIAQGQNDGVEQLDAAVDQMVQAKMDAVTDEMFSGSSDDLLAADQNPDSSSGNASTAAAISNDSVSNGSSTSAKLLAPVTVTAPSDGSSSYYASGTDADGNHYGLGFYWTNPAPVYGNAKNNSSTGGTSAPAKVLPTVVVRPTPEDLQAAYADADDTGGIGGGLAKTAVMLALDFIPFLGADPDNTRPQPSDATEQKIMTMGAAVSQVGRMAIMPGENPKPVSSAEEDLTITRASEDNDTRISDSINEDEATSGTAAGAANSTGAGDDAQMPTGDQVKQYLQQSAALSASLKPAGGTGSVPMYDANGNYVGMSEPITTTVDANGNLVDANGNPIPPPPLNSSTQTAVAGANVLQGPSYIIGESDGGPGTWGYNWQGYPKDPDDAAFQQSATGAPAGVEYGVDTTLMSSGIKWFDGYDPSTNYLIDAKNFFNWPNPDLPFSMASVTADMIQSDAIAGQLGTMVEFRVASQAKADLLTSIAQQNNLTHSVVVYWKP